MNSPNLPLKNYICGLFDSRRTSPRVWRDVQSHNLITCAAKCVAEPIEWSKKPRADEKKLLDHCWLLQNIWSCKHPLKPSGQLSRNSRHAKSIQLIWNSLHVTAKFGVTLHDLRPGLPAGNAVYFVATQWLEIRESISVSLAVLAVGKDKGYTSVVYITGKAIAIGWAGKKLCWKIPPEFAR